VGSAVCVPSGATNPKFLISTPTMVRSVENVSETLNVALACAAAFQAVHVQNEREPGSIESVALVGMGAATGRVPPRVCANLMWTGYTLFNDYYFRDYDDLRRTIREQLGDVESRPEEERVRIRVPEPPADQFSWLTK
jgi:O-acetyl-ADP-ribose deacetylase (regulator of RNase III)